MSINLINLLAAISIGAVSGYLGSLMLTKRMALVGDALGHVALPGMGLALLLGLDVSLGAFVFLFLGIILIWFLEAKTSLPTETLVGVIFVLSLALGFLITPEPELLEALFGDISRINFLEGLSAIILSAVVLVVVSRIYSRVVLASISDDLAVASKINIKKYNLIYLLAIAVIVALGVRVVGSLLVGALVIVPAAASRIASANMRQYIFGSAILGALSCVFGILLFNSIGLPAGPLIILINVLFFLILFFLKKK